MKISSVLAALVLLIPLAGLSGCGGSGSSTGSELDGGAASLFATDDMSTAFDHVWVTVKQVVLVGAGGDRVMFDDAAGQVFDIKSLRDETGRRFRLLANHPLPAGKFSGIRIVLDESANVFPSGATAATVAKFDGAADGSKTLSIDFPAPKDLGRGSEVIVDFDLSSWTLTGDVITATDGQFLNIVEDEGVNDIHRHNQDDFAGSVSDVAGTAPDQTFTLTRGGVTVSVKTDANTSIFNASGTASPTLTDGEKVEVTGVYSTTDKAVVATSIKVADDPAHDHEVEIRGQVTEVSATDKTVKVGLFRASGFVPASTVVTIKVTDGTQFFSARGVALSADEFFAATTVKGFLEAQGALSGGVLTATKIKVEAQGNQHGGGGDDTGGAGEKAAFVGMASDVDATAGTFTLAVSRWEGLLFAKNAPLKVSTSATTRFSVNGSTATAAEFFAALTTSATAKNSAVGVAGLYDEKTRVLAAMEVKLGPATGTGGNDR